MKPKIASVKFFLKSIQATSGPPIGPVLGQFGINIVEFCKDFNKRTLIYKKETLLKVVVDVFTDKTYSFKVTPFIIPLLIKRLLYIQRQNTTTTIAKLPIRFLYELACMQSSNFDEQRKLVKMYLGTISAMKIKLIW